MLGLKLNLVSQRGTGIIDLCLSPVRGTGVARLPTWPCVHRVPHPASTFVIVAGKVRLTQVATRGEGQPAGGREWARVALKDKELHKPQFFACPPHKSVIYIHNFTYFSSTYQVHLMWNNKLLDLTWRWIQNFTTPHEINKPYEFNWTKKINVCHVSAILKHVTELSFHESEQTVPAVNAISSDFLCMNFLCESFGFFPPEIFVRQKCFVFFFCVCTCTNLLVLNTEVKECYVHELNSNGAIKPVLVSVLYCTDQQCIFMEINTFELSWVECGCSSLRNPKLNADFSLARRMAICLRDLQILVLNSASLWLTGFAGGVRIIAMTLLHYQQNACEPRVCRNIKISKWQ